MTIIGPAFRLSPVSCAVNVRKHSFPSQRRLSGVFLRWVWSGFAGTSGCFQGVEESLTTAEAMCKVLEDHVERTTATGPVADTGVTVAGTLASGLLRIAETLPLCTR